MLNHPYVACLQVELDLDLNAYSNARVHFEQKKARDAKHQKTVEQNRLAFAAAEMRAKQQLSQAWTLRLVLCCILHDAVLKACLLRFR